MHNVKSKYKNPDEYIRQLKARIKLQRTWIDEDRERRKGLRGELITAWQPGSPDRQNNSSNCRLGDFHVDDKILVIGRIVKVVESACDAGNRESYVEFKRLETRRIKE